MAYPASDSYSCASGGVISGGRYRITPGDYRFSVWGQSNGVGDSARSELSTSPLSSDAGLAAFEAGTFDRVYIWNGSVYTKLIPSSNSGAYATKFGPEFGIAVRWMRETNAEQQYEENQTGKTQAATLAKELNSDNEKGDQAKEAKKREILERFKQKASRDRENDRSRGR